MRNITLTAVIVLLSLLSSSSAQNNPNPLLTGPHLTISTRNNQLSFHIGEIIPIDLGFTSSSHNKYQLDMATYDRSGRLSEDRFVVDPSTGWDDPLQLYFHSYNGFIGGGLRGFEVLSPTPRTIHAELNEWIRFKTPGQYRITVISGRVSETGSSRFGGPGVTSNSLMLTIVPATREWQESTLKKALQILDSTKAPAVPPVPNPSDLRTQAIKTLRYLGSVDAAREMAHRLTGGDSDWDFAAGLVGSPARTVALEEMKKLLVNPSFPVTGRFLSTMSVLALPEGSVDNVPAQREKAEAQFRQELISAMGEKEGAARAVSNSSIVEDAAIHSSPLPADLKRTMTRGLVDTFDTLTPQKQAELMQYRWNALDHQEMLPLLRKIAQRYQDFPQLREMNAFQLNSASAAALEHWYEMAPDEARPVIIQEILRPRPRFNAKVLGILPDGELPDADRALVEHLGASPDFDVRSNVASLIQRYGTHAVEPDVLNFLDPVVGKLECAVQEPLLAYVLKFDPEAARPRLERAMADRGKGFTACNHFLLQEVAASRNDSMLQDIAIKSLDDPDPQVVGSAATYLKEFGSALAEDVLWAHLIAWSERWKGRDKELQYVSGQSMAAMYEAGAGSKIEEALATGHAWLADEAKLRRLVDLSVSLGQRQQAEQFVRAWQTHPWSIAFIPFGGGQFQIAQYHEVSIDAAKEKLLQFPRGSKFQWLASGQDSEAKAFEEMSRFATEHGLKLVSTKQ
jgi:hypothetical protein